MNITAHVNALLVTGRSSTLRLDVIAHEPARRRIWFLQAATPERFVAHVHNEHPRGYAPEHMSGAGPTPADALEAAIRNHLHAMAGTSLH